MLYLNSSIKGKLIKCICIKGTFLLGEERDLNSFHTRCKKCFGWVSHERILGEA